MSFRSGPFSQGSQEPLTYLRGLPVDLTTILVACHVVIMLSIVLILSFSPALFRLFWDNTVFTSDVMGHGRVWTLLTHPFLHYIPQEKIWFAIDMFLFYMIGREVERYIGRRSYFTFYALLILVPSLLLTLGAGHLPLFRFYGSSVLHLGVFIGFVSIYPGVQFIPGLAVRWIAWVTLAIYSLIGLASHDWPTLLYLWTTVGVAYSYMRYTGATGEIGLLQWLEGFRQQQAEKQFNRRREAYQARQQQLELSVDAVLEKISSQGINSLNARERAVLEKASQRLTGNGPRPE